MLQVSLKITVLWFGLDNNYCFFHFCIVWRFLLRTEAGSPKISLQRRQRRRSPKALCLLRKISVNLRGNTLESHKHHDRDSCSSSFSAATPLWLTGLGISLVCLRWHMGNVPLCRTCRAALHLGRAKATEVLLALRCVVLIIIFLQPACLAFLV